MGRVFISATHKSSGKTTICECACIWAVLYGHRDFVCLIGSDEGHAMDMLESIKTELDANDLLLADYPEVCHPIAALDGIVDAVRRYRPNMPPAERDRLLSDLNTTVNNTNAPPRERITAAMATVLVLNQEQQPAPRQLTPAQQEQWDRAKAVLEQIMRSGQL